MRHIWLLLAFSLASLVIGCSSTSAPALDAARALVATGGTGVAKDRIPVRLDLRRRYLRVEVKGYPPGLLRLGFVDAHPGGPIEVWYSGDREALRTQNGRMVGATGTMHEWLVVKLEPQPPVWTSLRADGTLFERRRDEMPGYRFGIAEQMLVKPWPGMPPIELMDTLPREKAATYRWFRETSKQTAGRSAAPLPDSWFAWGWHRGNETVVYSEQCLAADFCLKLQRWPLMDDEP